MATPAVSQLHWKKSAACSTPMRLPFWLRTPDFHIPQGYQGRSPCLVSASEGGRLARRVTRFGAARRNAGPEISHETISSLTFAPDLEHFLSGNYVLVTIFLRQPLR